MRGNITGSSWIHVLEPNAKRQTGVQATLDVGKVDHYQVPPTLGFFLFIPHHVQLELSRSGRAENLLVDCQVYTAILSGFSFLLGAATFVEMCRLTQLIELEMDSKKQRSDEPDFRQWKRRRALTSTDAQVDSRKASADYVTGISADRPFVRCRRLSQLTYCTLLGTVLAVRRRRSYRDQILDWRLETHSYQQAVPGISTTEATDLSNKTEVGAWLE